MFNRLVLAVSLLFGSLNSMPTWAASGALSNELPLEFVTQLQKDGLWKVDYDDATTPSGRDLREFWDELLRLPPPNVGTATQSEAVIDRLFGFMSRSTNSANAFDDKAPAENLYPIKFRLIRFLLRPADANGIAINVGAPGNENLARLIRPMQSKLADLERRWKNRYIETVISLIKVANIDDYLPIVSNFTRQLLKGQIKIHDLSPVERVEVQKRMSSSHGVSIELKYSKNGVSQYKVVGLYNSDENYLSLDFSRPMEDTLTTFAHEIVHAADERLGAYRETYRSLFPEVKNIVLRWALVNDDRDKKIWSELDFLSLVETAFDRADVEADVQLRQEIRAKSVEITKQNLIQQLEEVKNRAMAKNQPAALPTEAEIQTVRKWLRAYIGLTVENEYRAHGLSIQLQAVLTKRSQLLFPSETLERHLDRFSAGDANYAFYLSQQMNPIEDFKGAIERSIGARNDDSALGSRMASNVLRILFYDETNLFLEKLDQQPSRFSAFLAELKREQKENEETWKHDGDLPILPDWAEKGKWGLPTNPHQLVSAIPTTAWVVGYRQRLEAVERDLRKLMEPIFNWRVKVLDLSDLSIEDAARVGIFEAKFSSRTVTVPPGTDPTVVSCLKANRDTFASPELFNKYERLRAVNWSELSSPGASQIRAEELMSNLIGHRLVRAHAVLTRLYPILRNDIVSLQTLQEKLNAQHFAQESDFPIERRAELNQEIDFIREYRMIDVKNEILKLGILLDGVGKTFETFAHEKSWSGLASSFNQLHRRVLANLDISVFGGERHSESYGQVVKASNQLRDQLKPYAKICSGLPMDESWKLFPFASQAPRFQIAVDGANWKMNFPLMLNCYGGNLYAVRQPCDYTQFMTRQTPEKQGAIRRSDGREDPTQHEMQAKIFFDSREILLFPVDMRNEEVQSPRESKRLERQDSTRASDARKAAKEAAKLKKKEEAAAAEAAKKAKKKK